MKNISALETDGFWREVEHEETIKRIPVAIVVGLFSVVGILGNVHILIVFSRKLKNHSTYHVLVSALAVSDLAVCATYLPVEITMVMKPFSFDYDIICRLALFNSYIWGIWTAFLTLLVAIERYRRICSSFSDQITCSTARKFCIVLFFLALFNAAPIGYIAGTHTFELANGTQGFECFVSEHLTDSYIPTGYFSFLLIEVLVIGFAIVMLYVPIRNAIKSSNTLRQRIAEPGESETKISSEKSKESIFTVFKSLRIQGKTEESHEERIATFTEIAESAENPTTLKANREWTLAPTQPENNKGPNTLKVLRSISSESTCSLGRKKPHAERSLSSKPLCTTRSAMITHAVTKVTIGLFLISIIFFVTLITYLVLALLRILAEGTLSEMTDVEAYIFLFGFELGYLNHVVNCFIYFYNDRRFRKELQTIYFCFL